LEHRYGIHEKVTVIQSIDSSWLAATQSEYTGEIKLVHYAH